MEDNASPIPVGYCQCGCGRMTPLATRNRRDLGWVKGQPLQYVRGHNPRYRASPPDVPEDQRWCGKCQQAKPLTEFYKHTGSRGGYQGVCKECSARNHKHWTQENRQKERFYTQRARLRDKYGITIEAYNDLLARQGGKCAICGQSEATIHSGHPRLMAVDHDHDTGAIRGLLCNNCNRALGLFGDSLTVLRRAVEYLSTSP